MFGIGKLWREWFDPGRAAREYHSAWLTWALSSGKRLPRIPTRRVSQGGFERMMSRPEGRARAERWWAGALERVGEAGGPRR